jgi:hypothetical protein
MANITADRSQTMHAHPRLMEIWRRAHEDCGAALAGWRNAPTGAAGARWYAAYCAALRREEQAASALQALSARAAQAGGGG